MQPLTSSMARAANVTLDWFRALGKQEARQQHGVYIKRTLEAYRLQPVSAMSALSPERELENAE